MSAEEGEFGFLELYGKLTGYYQVINRLLCFSPVMTEKFFPGMNIFFSKKFSEMKRNHKLLNAIYIADNAEVIFFNKNLPMSFETSED